MALKQNANAPWYEKSGLIRIPTAKPFDYGLNGSHFQIPLQFSFPIGSESVKYIDYMWGSIYFNPEKTRVQNGSEYSDKTYMLDVKSFGYGWVGEHVFYESKSNYARILVTSHQTTNYMQLELIFFSNGNIQIKANGNHAGYANSDINNGYTNLYYQYKTSTAENAKWEYSCLVNDTVRMTKDESILIVRNSATNYQVYHNSYWENDSTYTIPLRTKIINEILLFQKDKDNKYFSDNGFYEIPLYATSTYNSRIKIKTDKGVGNMRTQTPVTQDLINPPFYLYDNNKKLQASTGFNSTKVNIFQVISNSWGNLVNNMYPQNSSTYYWINPSYRFFDEAVPNVSKIHIRAGVNKSKGTDINNMLYVYYSSLAQDGLRSNNFTYATSVSTTGNSGEYNDIVITLPSKQTIGSIILLCGITGANAYSALEFDYTIALEVQNGLQLM